MFIVIQRYSYLHRCFNGTGGGVFPKANVRRSDAVLVGRLGCWCMVLAASSQRHLNHLSSSDPKQTILAGGRAS
jgi:hypothetical protein